jgi:DNA-binding NtrC family response regulator
MDEQALPTAQPSVVSEYATLPTATTTTPAYAMPSYASTGNFAVHSPIEVREMPEPVNLEDAVKSSEHQVIMAAIQSTDSRMAAAAKLGISPRTLRYKLAQLRSRGISEGVSA